MPVKSLHLKVLTLATGLAIMAAGALLTWYQVSESDLNRAAVDARAITLSTERLLDETRSAIDRARPLLTKPCTQEVSSGLSRLAIGIEHIRVINFFDQNILACSSFEGADPVREFISADDIQVLLLTTDDYISPGESVMILRQRYGNLSITASVATQWIAGTLRFPGIRRSFSLRVGNTVLTRNNMLLKASRPRDTYAVHSEHYPFSVEFSVDQRIPVTLFLQNGALSLLLSALLGTSVSTVLWLILFRRRTLSEVLRRAVSKGEIVPWYQPIMDATTGRIVGVEVLARWEKPDGTVLSPASFIAEAESSNLIMTLTRHLMEQTARELSSLLKDQPLWHVGFNITQAHIQETGFITECLSFITAFPPDSINLTIELTEREPFAGSEEIRSKLERLHASGITIALDDFGTGYANMEYLSEIPVDIIKIDRVFVSKLSQGPAAEQLLISLIDMACGLNMDIVAEGVETEMQANWLREHGVGWLQGYFYSQPVPLTELKQQLFNAP